MAESDDKRREIAKKIKAMTPKGLESRLLKEFRRVCRLMEASRNGLDPAHSDAILAFCRAGLAVAELEGRIAADGGNTVSNTRHGEVFKVSGDVRALADARRTLLALSKRLGLDPASAKALHGRAGPVLPDQEAPGGDGVAEQIAQAYFGRGALPPPAFDDRLVWDTAGTCWRAPEGERWNLETQNWESAR